MSVLTDAGKVVSTLRREGVEGAARSVSRRAAERWGGNVEPIRLRPADIADSTVVGGREAARGAAKSGSLDIGWILTPPAPASGGHTTIFRFVEALERAGHRCTLYIYDTQLEGAEPYRELIRRWWPQVRAEIRAVSDGIGRLDAYVATAWTTAHVLASRPQAGGERFYLVQDFEPWFYPRGIASELAEDTYRFGFHPITVGYMLAGELKQRYGSTATVAEFGCDTEVYRVDNTAERDGIVFYAKPGVARRGYELGVWALQRLHELRPELPIYTFGIKARALGFPATVYEHLRTSDLNELYNRCAAGLALSFSNISLIPYELLASGVMPVMNDFEGLRANLGDRKVVWSRPTPDALAEALIRATELQKEFGAQSLRESVAGMSWRVAQSAVVDAIETRCAGS